MLLSQHASRCGLVRLFQNFRSVPGLVQASHIYSDEFLKIDQFRKIQDELKSRFSQIKNKFPGKEIAVVDFFCLCLLIYLGKCREANGEN